MSFRTWLYSTLTGEPLPHDAQLRVFAKKSMRTSVEETPYIVYKLGNDSNIQLSEELTTRNQFFQIYVHDFADTQTADYMRIDAVIKELKRILHNASYAEDGVIGVQWLENSQDLNDETLGTVFKYMRFVAVVRS